MALLSKSINYIQSYALTIEFVLYRVWQERDSAAHQIESKERDENNFNNKDIRESAFTPFRSLLPNTRPLFQWLNPHSTKLIDEKRDLWLYNCYINLRNFSIIGLRSVFIEFKSKNQFFFFLLWILLFFNIILSSIFTKVNVSKFWFT